MSFVIETTDGVAVDGQSKDTYQTVEAAEASVKDRNARAEQLGIKARYQIRK